MDAHTLYFIRNLSQVLRTMYANRDFELRRQSDETCVYYECELRASANYSCRLLLSTRKAQMTI